MWSALLAKEQHSKSGYPLPQAASSLEFQGKPCHRNLNSFSASLANPGPASYFPAQKCPHFRYNNTAPHFDVAPLGRQPACTSPEV